MSSPKDPRVIEREGYEIAKSIFRGLYVEYEEEEEGKKLTMSNLRNMLEAAREAERIGSYDYFRLRAAYIARQASTEDSLHIYVRRLLGEINRRRGWSEADRIRLAIAVLTASIYLFTALRNNFRNLIYEKGG